MRSITLKRTLLSLHLHSTQYTLALSPWVIIIIIIIIIIIRSTGR
jgi:hypothetical protein